IAVVNIGLILEKYDPAQEIKDDLQQERENLNQESVDKIVAAWKDIQSAIRNQAAARDIDIVFGYSDPADKNQVKPFPNAFRKMDAMDMGGSVALLVSPRTDITLPVLDVLTKKKNERKNKDGVPAGTSRVAVVNIGHVYNQYKKAIKLKAEVT